MQPSAIVHSLFGTAHNLKVTGSNPVPATNAICESPPPETVAGFSPFTASRRIPARSPRRRMSYASAPGCSSIASTSPRRMSAASCRVSGAASVAREIGDLGAVDLGHRFEKQLALASCPRNQNTTQYQTLKSLPHGRLFAFQHPWKHCGSKRARSLSYRFENLERVREANLGKMRGVDMQLRHARPAMQPKSADHADPHFTEESSSQPFGAARCVTTMPSAIRSLGCRITSSPACNPDRTCAKSWLRSPSVIVRSRARPSRTT